jgi:hypothetical protein
MVFTRKSPATTIEKPEDGFSPHIMVEQREEASSSGDNTEAPQFSEEGASKKRKMNLIPMPTADPRGTRPKLMYGIDAEISRPSQSAKMAQICCSFILVSVWSDGCRS